jgi:four helix bundle protein
MEEGRFRLDDFELYRTAREFRKRIYQLVKRLPRNERFCLDPQMRRAAVSITNNIAEGHGRWHYQENIQFCRMARGSVEEMLDDLNVCLDEQYCDAEVAQELISAAYFLIGKINGYIAYLRRCKQADKE